MTGRLQIDAAEVKAQVSLAELVGRDVEWDRRKSNPARGDWWAPCPLHAERTASFHVVDRDGFFYCFGCHAKGDAFSYLAEAHNMDFRTALAELAAFAGIDLEAGTAETVRSRAETATARRAGEAAHRARAPIGDNPHPAGDPLRTAWREGWRDAEDRWRTEHAWLTAREGLERAAAIWRAARPVHPVLDGYLAARGVDVGAVRAFFGGGWPPTIRCHPALPYFAADRSGGRPREVHRGPAMVGLIAAPDFRLGAHRRIAGVHRTWITAEGRARIDGAKLDKRMIGATGHIMPVPIRLTPHGDCPLWGRRMIVGEGIESVLTIWSRLLADWQAGRRPFWAAEVAKTLGAVTGEDDPRSRVRNPATGQWWPGTEPDWARPGWQAPDRVDELVILAEGSSKDPVAAERRYTMARRRHSWRRDGRPRSCSLRLPGGDWSRDVDFADVAASEGARE